MQFSDEFAHKLKIKSFIHFNSLQKNLGIMFREESNFTSANCDINYVFHSTNLNTV